MTLTEFLREHAAEAGTRAEQRRAKREEWVQSVGRLLQQVRQWIREADPEGTLQIIDEEHEIAERSIGRYTAPGLLLRLENRQARIVPVARSVIADIGEGDRAEGRVDITDGSYRHHVYRVLKNGSEFWYVLDEDTFLPRAFDKAVFEEALVDVLR